MMVKARIVTLVAIAAFAAACGGNTEPKGDVDMGMTTPNTDSGSTPDASSEIDSGAGTPDMSTGMDTGATPDVGSPDMGTGTDAGVQTLTEMEPNNGAMVEEVNPLPFGAVMQGNIDAGDQDIFQIDTEPGRVYVATLTPDDGSMLQPHLTVMDDGRGGDAPSEDYIKIMRGSPVQFLAMGEEGYYVTVRDGRNVPDGTAGGAGFGYTLTVTEVPVGDVVRGDIGFDGTLSGTLDGPGAIDLWSFDGVAGTDIVVDFATSGDLNGRLYIFAQSQGSWIMRNDNRSGGNPDPLLDAFLTADGPMYLVVESIAEQATDTSYTINATSN